MVPGRREATKLKGKDLDAEALLRLVSWVLKFRICELLKSAITQSYKQCQLHVHLDKGSEEGSFWRSDDIMGWMTAHPL